MPWGLARYQQARQLHFITFSCYQRAPFLSTSLARDVFVRILETVRGWYDFYLVGYVVMPEHVHLLMSEPSRNALATTLQMLKQMTCRKLFNEGRFWQERYYDFNVWTEHKQVEKLRYIHRNPVKRGLVTNPEDWSWSSFRHYMTGEESAVEIESHWTASKRKRLGIHPTVEIKSPPFAPR